MRRPLALLGLLLISPLAVSCGNTKPLERPAPLFGKDRAKYEAEMAREKAQKEAAKHKQPPGGTSPPPPAPDAPIPAGPMAPQPPP